MEPRRRHFASVVRVASQCRGGKVPLSGQASISLSMAFEPSATIQVGGKVPIPCQFAATDNNDNAHLPGAIPHLLDLPASLLEAVRLPMVACQVSYAYLTDMWLLYVPLHPIPTVCVALWVKASVSKSYGEGYSPNCLGQSAVPLRFIMKSLTNSLDAGQNGSDA